MHTTFYRARALLEYCVLLGGCKNSCACLGQRPGIEALLAAPFFFNDTRATAWAALPAGIAMIARSPAFRPIMVQDKRQDVGDASVKICYSIGPNAAAWDRYMQTCA